MDVIGGVIRKIIPMPKIAHSGLGVAVSQSYLDLVNFCAPFDCGSREHDPQLMRVYPFVDASSFCVLRKQQSNAFT